jgi:hypothetical protein
MARKDLARKDLAHKDLAQKDIAARGSAAPAKRAGKAVHATPMAEQRPDDYGASSAPQRLIRLVGCYDPKAREDHDAPPKRKPTRSRPRHRITVTE